MFIFKIFKNFLFSDPYFETAITILYLHILNCKFIMKFYEHTVVFCPTLKTWIQLRLYLS